MSNLLNSEIGRNVVLTAQRHLLERRLSRFFKRNLVIDYEQWRTGGEFDLATLLGNLNVAHDTELTNLYRLLGIAGGLSETIADLTFYVDPTGGSDTTGTGSSSRPFASLWFLNRLPKRIAHSVRIYIMDDLTHDGDIVLDNTFIGDGYLSIIGVGAPVVGSVPSMTSSAVTTLTGLGGVAVDTVDVFVEDHNSGWWLQTLSGAKPNYAVPAHKITLGATSTIICRRMPISTMVGGDTFRLIKPARTVTINGSLTIQAKGPKYESNFTGRGSRIVFCNMNLDISSGGAGAYNKLLIDSQCQVSLTFVNLVNTSTEMHVYSDLNTASAIDEQLTTLSLSTVANLDHETTGIIYRMAGLLCGLAKETSIDIWAHSGAKIYSTDFHSAIEVSGSSEVQHSAGVVYFSEKHIGRYYAILADGYDGPGYSGAGISMHDSKCQIDYLDVLASDSCINVNNSDVSAGLIYGNDGTYSVITFYGINFNGVGIVQFNDDPTGCTGAANDIWFQTSAFGSASAHPAAWASVTDGQHSHVKRMGV